MASFTLLRPHCDLRKLHTIAQFLQPYRGWTLTVMTPDDKQHPRFTGTLVTVTDTFFVLAGPAYRVTFDLWTVWSGRATIRRPNGAFLWDPPWTASEVH